MSNTMSLNGGYLEYRNLFDETENERYGDGIPPKGRKVQFTESGGWDNDIEKAKKYFLKNAILHVKEIYVGRSSSKVEFIEFPGIYFNTVMFKDI